MTQKIEQHISNMINVKKSIIHFGSFLDKREYEALHSYLEERFSTYITSFKEIFQPDKKIDDDMIYFADVRNLSKYNEDIISGWLIEDFFIFLFQLNIFKEHNFTFQLNSHDADRIIKKERTYINSEPDFTIINRGTSFKVEIQSLLIKYNKFHIKENKANKLLYAHSFLLCFLLKEKRIVFFYPNDIKKYGRLTKIKAYGGKSGYEYMIADLPKHKSINKNNFLKKLTLVFYWFLYDKKRGNSFDLFCQSSIDKYHTIDTLLNYLKKENKK